MFDFSTIEEVRLSKGAHDSPARGMCFMEMAAWFAGEEHSDKPDCVSPALGHLGIAINDSMENEPRDRLLKPMIPHVVGTADEAAETGRIEYICLRAFNYALGILSPGFARRYRGARSYGEAQSMAGHLYEDHRHRLARGKHSGEVSMSMLPNCYLGDEEAIRERLYDTVRAMLERRADFRSIPISLAVEPLSVTVSPMTIAHPNAANAAAAGGVFSLMGDIIPDWSAALDTLREAIKLGRHDGFDIATNLEARHVALRELVDA